MSRELYLNKNILNLPMLILIVIALNLFVAAQALWPKLNSIPTSKNINGIVAAGGSHVAVGDSGTILTSTDGLTWKMINSGITDNLSSICWNGSKFFASGWKTVISSSDGESWVKAGVDATIRIFWINNQLIRVGVLGISTSQDGAVWDKRELSYQVNDVLFDGTNYIAVGDTSWWDMGQENCAVILQSSDLRNWSRVSVAAFSSRGTMLNRIIRPNDKYIAIGCGMPDMVSSVDGITWNAEMWDNTCLFCCASNDSTVVFGGSDNFLLCGSTLVASVGSGWDINDVIWDGNRFIAVGDYGTIIVSDSSSNAIRNVDLWDRSGMGLDLKISGNKAEFILPRSAKVSLAIYNVSGRCILQNDFGYIQEGNHAFSIPMHLSSFNILFGILKSTDENNHVFYLKSRLIKK